MFKILAGQAKQQRAKGLTLFELTVVIAIAAILFILAVYSIQSLISNTKVSRVKEEHRSITRALQNYIMDYSSVPSSKQGFLPLTQPTAYLGDVPKDPFQENSGTYLYLVPDETSLAAVVISPGPDGDFDLPPELWEYTSTQAVSRKLVPQAVRARQMNQMLSQQTPDGLPSNGYSPRGGKRMSETEEAILSTYLKLGQYDQEKGPNGDIITLIGYR